MSAVYIKSGMSHNRGAQVRPFDNKGICGIVPKVKINYTEVATHCSLNKDVCKTGCEQIFRFLSDKARKGENVMMDIPLVGAFILRTGISSSKSKRNFNGAAFSFPFIIDLLNPLYRC